MPVSPTSKITQNSCIIILLLLSILFNPLYAEAVRAVRVGVYDAGSLARFDKDGSAHGFFVDMLNHIAQKEQWNVQYVPGSWQEGLDRLKSDRIDMVLCIGYTDQRRQYMDFPQEFLVLNWGVLYKPKGSRITSLLELDGKSVSALKGDVYLTGFLELVRQFNLNIKIQEVDEYPKVFKAVESGTAAAGVAGNLYGILNENGRRAEQTPIIFSPIKVGYAVNKDKNGDLIAALDRNISEMKADKTSTYHHELDHLLGRKDSKIPKEVYWALSGVAAALILAIIFVFLLRRQVNEKTKHLEAEIIEHKTDEENLLGQLLFVQQLIDAIPIPIFYKDRQGIFRGCNTTYEKFLGMTKEQIVGKTVFGITSKDLANIYYQADEALFANPGVQVYETSFLHADGSTRHIIFNKASYLRTDGCVAGLVGAILDITERKLAEEEIRHTSALLDSIFENFPNMIFLKDAKDLRFARINKTGEDLLGFSRNELLGKSDYDFFPKEQAEFFIEKDRLVLTKKTIVYIDEETINTRVHGARILSTRKIPILNANDEPEYLLGVSEDITDNKRVAEEKRGLEERLQRAEKMEALGTLAGGVAHDLNNVLGIMSGYSELLIDEIPEGNKSRGHVDKILQSTKKAAAIIDDLLTLARRGVMSSEVVSLNGIVSDFMTTPAFENIRNYHPRVTFRAELGDNIVNIKGSPVHLEKTLMNLVSNASEAIPGDGAVIIRTESRYLDTAIHGYDEIKEGDYSVLIVSDTGTGIPLEDREKIFEPFYTKKKMGRSGTGLGLAIVWGTVKDHNGYIDIQTGVGKGTTFTLYFPVTREELIAQQEKISSDQYMGHGESVLVVDDIEDQREIASRLLTKLGYKVHLESSGESAVEYLKANKADIVVLDMIMTPGIDGLETYKRILEINSKQKAIIVSGFSETDRSNEAQRLGAGAYVKKPYETETIGLAIRNELSRK